MASSEGITLTQLVIAVAFPTVITLVGFLVSFSQNNATQWRLDDTNANLIQLRTQTHSDLQLLTGKVIELMDRR